MKIKDNKNVKINNHNNKKENVKIIIITIEIVNRNKDIKKNNKIKEINNEKIKGINNEKLIRTIIINDNEK